jgi:UDP-glucuronate 4-epimerase
LGVKFLVTGVAGFIGSHVAQALLSRGEQVVGVDNFHHDNPLILKQARLAPFLDHPNFTFHRQDIAEASQTINLILAESPEIIIHLAAQAGVRRSREHPFDYVQSNLVGHVAILEAARALPGLRHLVYASSSSVYGNRVGGPFAETDRVDAPTSLYAATKRADELMSEVYASAFGLKASGLRFFTVYGPKGRPDMAYWIFAEKILKGEPIVAFDDGALQRDFTYIDDIVSGILAVAMSPPEGPAHRLYNIGNHKPETVRTLIEALEAALGQKATIVSEPKPDYDVVITYANIDAMKADFGWEPTTDLRTGIERFAAWYQSWHHQA